jgi:putative hydrolase of the HAD superfamily
VKFRGILFDVGGVFHVPQEDPRREYAFIRRAFRILEQAGITLSPGAGTTVETLREIIRAGEAEYRNYAVASRRELPPERIWTEYFLKALSLPPERLAPSMAEKLCRLYEERRRLIPRPSIRSVIESLHKMGLHQGIVSNVTSAAFTHRRLKRYRVAPFMETVILSSVTGIRKPDPAIFKIALEALGLKAAECVYVGDQISRDLLGGRKAGMGAVILFRPAEPQEILPEAGSLQPDLYVDSFTAIQDFCLDLG